MSSLYSKQHYEDVTRILSRCIVSGTTGSRGSAIWADKATAQGIAQDFADLFAADNPKRCTFHGDHDTGYSEDCKITGFDRERFLAACGLQGEVGCIVEPEPQCPHCGQTTHTIGECV